MQIQNSPQARPRASLPAQVTPQAQPQPDRFQASLEEHVLSPVYGAVPVFGAFKFGQACMAAIFSGQQKELEAPVIGLLSNLAGTALLFASPPLGLAGLGVAAYYGHSARLGLHD